MSKGSSDDINMTYLNKLADAVTNLTVNLEKISPSYGAGGQLEKVISDLSKQLHNGEITLKQLLKGTASAQKDIRSLDYGIKDTAQYTRTINAFVKLLEEKIKNSKVDDELVKKLATAFENLDVTAILESEKKSQSGSKGAPLKNVMDNEKLNRVNEDLAKRIGVKLDEDIDKLLDFYQEKEKEKEKKTKRFVDDLVDSLEKSKWIGGAARDTFRLLGFLGASWLQQFGKFGKILGAAFYVAMETFGPTLAKLLVESIFKGMAGLTKALWGVISGLGAKAGWGIVNALPQSGPLGNAITTFYAGGTTAQKAAAAKSLAGAGLVAGAATAVGGWAIGQGIDSWKQGRKGNAAALGLGGAGLIAGGIAALVAGLSAPITVPLLAISGTVVAIAAIWKHHSETIKKWASKFGEFVTKVLDFFGFMESSTKKDKESEGPVSAGFTKTLSDTLGIGTTKMDKLKLGSGGEVLNARDLSQSELRAQMEAYQKANPTQFGRLYEVVSSKYANVAGFKNDAVMADKNTGKLGALMYAGASADMERIRQLAKQAGMSENRVAQILYTGGWSTKSSGHKRGTTVSGALGHDNPYALAYDIGLAGFSPQEQEIITTAARQAAQERAERTGVKNAKLQNVRHEVKVNGAYKFSEHYQQGANPLIHTQLFSGYTIPQGARENYKDIKEQEKAKAQQHSIEVKKIAEFIAPEEVKDEIKRDADHKLDDNQYGAILKKHGIYRDVNTGYYLRKGGEEILMQDNNTGTLSWSRILNTMQGAAQGTTGR